MSILAVDVGYRDTTARAAGVTFDCWEAKTALSTHTVSIDKVADYEPGLFYKRELPCILDLLKTLPASPIDVIVIDGYVSLDDRGRPGLGEFLYAALGRQTPIIGVAKTPFLGSPHAWHVMRGQSRRPLFVTAAGMDPYQASENIRVMDGPHRLPTLLKQVDQLCRG